MTRWTRFAPAHADRWRPWLVYPGSLTRRIVERSRRFRVEVVRQGGRVPHEDERRVLGLAAGVHAHVREVVLVADGVAVVVAHSIVAARDVLGVWRALRSLGTRPLAALLFADPRVRRHGFEYARLERRHPLARRVRAIAGPLPGILRARRSVFTRHGRRLMVTEVFLPTLAELTR